MNSEITDADNVAANRSIDFNSLSQKWAPALMLPMAVATTLAPILQWSERRINRRRLIAYCLLWPGMDARAFCRESVVPTPNRSEWKFAGAKILLGASLLAAIS